MPDHQLLELYPHVPGGFLGAFLRGAGCLHVNTASHSPLELWVDFSFRGERFSAHQDIHVWRFFVESESCPEAVLHELAARLKSSGGISGWIYVVKGWFL